MKKITLSIGLLAAILSTKAQDTTCTYFTGKRVLEFDYKMDTILYEQEHKTKFFDITVEYGNVLCLDLSDNKNRLRKVKTTFFTKVIMGAWAILILITIMIGNYCLRDYTN